MIEKTKISDSLSIVTESITDIPSSALGIFIQHGSRNENKDNYGICHLIEHMLFKGTKTKSAQDIASLIESNGIILDGFTTKETSGIYCRFLAHQLDLVLDLIFELLTESKFDEKELQKEIKVIESEINGSNEDPQEQVFNLLYEALFNDHPLAHPISGNIETIRTFTSAKISEYYRNHFINSKICISCAGKIDHKELVKKITDKHHFNYTSKPSISESRPLLSEQNFLIQERSDLTQLYVTAANFTYRYADSRRYALSVLNHILGGTISSRLFQRLRDQDGLVYTISSFLDFFSDIGIFGTYYITEAKNIERVTDTGIEIAKELKQNGVTDEEMQGALNYLKASVAISAENPMSRMIRNAQNELILENPISVEESLAYYDRLSLKDVNMATDEINPDKYSVAIVGQSKLLEQVISKHPSTQKIIVKK